MTTTDQEVHPVDAGVALLDQTAADLKVVSALLAARKDDLPDVPVRLGTYDGNVRVLLICIDADELAGVARVLADHAPVGSVVKEYEGDLVIVQRAFGSVAIKAFALRESVCTRRVVGTETVTIPDPAVPMIEVTRDKVEWDCEPLLAIPTADREVA